MSARLFAPLAALAIVTFAARAGADDVTDLEGALSEPIVSTPSKEGEAQSLAPATSSSVTAEELRRYGIRSLDEAINFLSLGMVATNPLYAAEVGARGVLLTNDYGNHVLLLVNGHQINEPWNGTAYYERGAGVPMELIDHIEIILGPGSVLYGSNAMLGVINVVTKRAKDYRGLRLIVDGSLSPSVNGANELRAPSFASSYTRDLGTGLKIGAGIGHQFMLGKTPSELTLQVEYFTSNGPAFTFGPQAYGNDAVTGQPRIFTTRSDGPPPGVWGGVARDSYFTRAPAGHLRFISGGWEVNLRASTFRRGSPYWSFGDFDNASAGELDRFLALDVKYRRALSRLADVSVRAYGDLYDYEYRIPQPAAETCLDGQTHGCVGVDLGASRWMGVETQLSFDWSTDTRFKTLLGMDARVRHVASEYQYVDAVTGVNPGSIGAFDTTEKLLALYAQQIVRPVAWLGINAGVRGDIEERFARASPRVAASARVWKDGTVKAIYAEAFRTPSTYERFFVDPSSEIGAPNLRPETVRSAEVSFEQRFGAQRILFGVFRSWWDDMISLEGLSEAEAAAAKARGEITPQTQAVTQYRNVSSIDNVGFNATYDGALGTERVRYALNVTAASARRNEEGEPTNRPLEVSPQIFGNARVAYDLGVGLPTLALAARYAGKAPLYNAYERAFPLAYATSMVETRATASGAMPGIAGLAYRFSASYAWNARTAYTAGPIEQATPELPRMERVPMERLRLMLGLEYVLDFAKAR